MVPPSTIPKCVDSLAKGWPHNLSVTAYKHKYSPVALPQSATDSQCKTHRPAHLSNIAWCILNNCWVRRRLIAPVQRDRWLQYGKCLAWDLHVRLFVATAQTGQKCPLWKSSTCGDSDRFSGRLTPRSTPRTSSLCSVALALSRPRSVATGSFISCPITNSL